jgi:hypothetical protein
MRRRTIWVLALIAVTAVVVTVVPATASAATLSCRGSALRVNTPNVNSEPVIANNPFTPCVRDMRWAAIQGIGGVGVAELFAQTAIVNGRAAAQAATGGVRINAGGHVIEASATQAEMTAGCSGRTSTRSGTSSVAALRIDGRPTQIVNQSVTLPLTPASAVLHVAVNERVSFFGFLLSVRAIHVVSPVLGIDIVVSEARANSARCP